MSRKVFTAGEVLAAADVNSFLMDQTVMSFAGTAARGSAIPSPVTGMTTYLEDTKDLQIYEGSAFSSPFGLTLVKTQSFSTASAVTLDNVFTSAYQNYRVIAEFSKQTAAIMNFRLRAAGSTISTSSYSWQRIRAFSGSLTESNQTDTALSNSLDLTNNSRAAWTYEIQNPVAAVNTTMQNTLFSVYLGNASMEIQTLIETTASARDGFTLFPASGTITGTIRVYGYRN